MEREPAGVKLGNLYGFRRQNKPSWVDSNFEKSVQFQFPNSSRGNSLSLSNIRRQFRELSGHNSLHSTNSRKVTPLFGLHKLRTFSYQTREMFREPKSDFSTNLSQTATRINDRRRWFKLKNETEQRNSEKWKVSSSKMFCGSRERRNMLKRTRNRRSSRFLFHHVHLSLLTKLICICCEIWCCRI